MSFGQVVVTFSGCFLGGHFAAKAIIRREPEWFLMSFVCFLIGVMV